MACGLWVRATLPAAVDGFDGVWSGGWRGFRSWILRNIDAVTPALKGPAANGSSVLQWCLHIRGVVTTVVGRSRISSGEKRTGRHTKTLLRLPSGDRAQGSGMKPRCTCHTALQHRVKMGVGCLAVWMTGGTSVLGGRLSSPHRCFHRAQTVSRRYQSTPPAQPPRRIESVVNTQLVPALQCPRLPPRTRSIVRLT